MSGRARGLPGRPRIGGAGALAAVAVVAAACGGRAGGAGGAVPGRRDGEALYGARSSARAARRTADAQRLVDRALVELERTTGTTAAPSRVSGTLAAAWTPDGRRLVVTDGKDVVLRDPTTLQANLRLAGHDAVVLALALSPDGVSIVSASLAGQACDLLPGYRVRIIDANHLAATERRLKVLHRSKVGPLPTLRRFPAELRKFQRGCRDEVVVAA